MKANILNLAAFSCLIAMLPAGAKADDKAELINASYVESFIPNAKVSGGLLVGVKWEDKTDAFSPHKVSIRAPKDTQGRKACVEINSQDGRYTAQNLYQIKSNPGDKVQFETKTAFAQDLSAYKTDSMAVNVRLVESCDSPETGTLIPASLGDGVNDGARKLVVLMNAEPHKLTLKLTKNGVEAGSFKGCTAVGSNVNVAFTSSCRIALDRASDGPYDLEVKVNERFDHVTKHFTLLLN